MLAMTENPAGPTTSSSIIVRRGEHPTLPFARVVYEDLDAVTVEYGRLACGQFIASESEYLSVFQYPELHGLYDGETWDIDALHALVSPAMSDEEVES